MHISTVLYEQTTACKPLLQSIQPIQKIQKDQVVKLCILTIDQQKKQIHYPTLVLAAATFLQHFKQGIVRETLL